MIEYSDTPTVSRNINLITESTAYNLLDVGCNTIIHNTILSEKVKESILNNYISVQFTTINH